MGSEIQASTDFDARSVNAEDGLFSMIDRAKRVLVVYVIYHDMISHAFFYIYAVLKS